MKMETEAQVDAQWKQRWKEQIILFSSFPAFASVKLTSLLRSIAVFENNAAAFMQ